MPRIASGIESGADSRTPFHRVGDRTASEPLGLPCLPRSGGQIGPAFIFGRIQPGPERLYIQARSFVAWQLLRRHRGRPAELHQPSQQTPTEPGANNSTYCCSQLANLRALYAYMCVVPWQEAAVHGPGRSATPWKWNHADEVPWQLLEHGEHAGHARPRTGSEPDLPRGACVLGGPISDTRASAGSNRTTR